MQIRPPYAHGFGRVAAWPHRTALADPARNAEAVLAMAAALDAQGTALAIFPELALSGYSIEDLLLQDVLLDAVEQAVATVLAQSVALGTLLVVGAPLRHAGRLYNTALVIHRGRLLGVVPKSYLPTYREFYEGRQFGAGRGLTGLEIGIGAMSAPFGTDLLFEAADLPGLTLGVEICEDMWIPVTPG